MSRQGSKRRAPKEQAQAEPDQQAQAAKRLLAWYDGHRRVLPWRSPPGQAADPYAVWLSEIMLQQTTVAAVKAYFSAFLALWPTVEDLADAPIEEVMRRWAGLGYYSRARNLHACAKRVAACGGFPQDEAGLQALPGIGPYTAAAIASIAFGRRAVVIDGNVDRVIVRLHGIERPIKDAKRDIQRFAEARTPAARCGDYAQAMMDLGATICTPRRPACVICPLADGCLARQTGRQDVLPIKAAKLDRPLRYGLIYYLRRGRDVLVRTRPEKGLLGGMTEFPGTLWTETPPPGAPPLDVPYVESTTPVEHGFTHFSLKLRVQAAEVAGRTPAPPGCRWIAEDRLPDAALPSLMRKVAVAAQATLRVPSTTDAAEVDAS